LDTTASATIAFTRIVKVNN